MCLLGRNGLGPSKEGEAQYSVVHCTGYIKAWPPAGRQTPNWYSCVYHCLTQTLPHGRTPLPHVVCVAWPNLKQLLIQQGFDSDTDAIPDPLQCIRVCWQSSSFVFIYLSLQLFVSVYETEWLNVSWLHSFPKWCLLSLNHAHVPPISGSSGSRVIQRRMCPLFLVQAVRFHADLRHHPVTENWERFAEIAGLAIVIPSKDFNSVGTKGCQILFCKVKYSRSLYAWNLAVRRLQLVPLL